MTKKDLERKIESMRRMVDELEECISDCEQALEDNCEDAEVENLVLNTRELFCEYGHSC